MPSRWTFTIKPIKELLAKYIGDGVGWVDPFAGKNSPAKFTNDLDESLEVTHTGDALDWLKTLPNNSAIGVLYDPPYSITQARKYGHKKYSSMKYWADVKNELTRILKVGGLAICCGWSSQGLGKNRGCQPIEILLVPHGGSKNDTIVTVEKKLNNTTNKEG